MERKLEEYLMIESDAEGKLDSLLPGKWNDASLEERIFILGRLCGKAQKDITMSELHGLIEYWKTDIKLNEEKKK